MSASFADLELKEGNKEMTFNWRYFAAISALVFGLLSVFSGGSVLYGSDAIDAMAGNTVGFVVWFNFLSGFVYVLAGVGIWLQKRWGLWLAILLAIAITCVAGLFGFHVLSGGDYEMRTVGALTFRTVFWVTIAYVLRKSAKNFGK